MKGSEKTIGFLVIGLIFALSAAALAEGVSPLPNGNQGVMPQGATGLTRPNSIALSATPMRGDVNGDGQVDVKDSLFIAQYCAGNRTLTPEQLSVADIDGDGSLESGFYSP